ncbi:MAG: Fic family protein, partial [Leptospirales bacterium]|nr:Fic family protein [Leptospirales bacterium]
MDEIYEKIAVKKHELDRLLKNRSNRTVLFDWLKFELAYTSNAVEGNTLSRRETVLAITEKITGGSKPIKDYIEARNHADAFQFVLDSLDTTPDRNLILGIHRRILSGIDDGNAGVYRNVHVRISGSHVVLPNYMKVPELMDEFFDWLKESSNDAVKKAFHSHFKLVSIHPFIDGNGRTARLLLDFILIQGGFAPIIIRPRDRKRYIDALENYQLTGNAEKYDRFMLAALSRSMSIAIDLLSK